MFWSYDYYRIVMGNPHAGSQVATRIDQNALEPPKKLTSSISRKLRQSRVSTKCQQKFIDCLLFGMVIMSLPYPFPFWVVAKQKSNDVGRLAILNLTELNLHQKSNDVGRLAILNLTELNLHPRPCPCYCLILC